VLSRAIIVPGVPDWVKLGVVKSGISQVANAVNGGKLPPEVTSRLLEAIGDGKVSDRLANEIAGALAPYIDLPILGKEQEHELIKSVVTMLIVQKEDQNILLNAASGTAKFATVQGRDFLTAVANLRTPSSRKALAKQLAKQIDVPFLTEETEEQILQSAVDALADVVMTRLPAGALEAAMEAGEDQEVEVFLGTILMEKMNMPLINNEQKQQMAQSVVSNWLSLVDKEELKKEKLEAEKRNAAESAQRQQALEQAAALGTGIQAASQSLGQSAGNVAMEWMKRMTSAEAPALASGGGGDRSIGPPGFGGGSGNGSSGGGGGGDAFDSESDSPNTSSGRTRIILIFLAISVVCSVMIALRRKGRNSMVKPLVHKIRMPSGIIFLSLAVVIVVLRALYRLLRMALTGASRTEVDAIQMSKSTEQPGTIILILGTVGLSLLLIWAIATCKRCLHRQRVPGARVS